MLMRTASAMEPESWSETISLASVDPHHHVRRLTSVSLPLQPQDHVIRRRDGVHFGSKPIPSEFAESAVCYVTNGGSSSSRRHYRSTVRYCGARGLRPVRFYETCFLIPRSLDEDDVTFTSLVESQPAAAHRWYSSALKLVPRKQSTSSTSSSSSFPAENSAGFVAENSTEMWNSNCVSRDENENKVASFRSQLVVTSGQRPTRVY